MVNIISLDGGGIRGLIEVVLLQRIEAKFPGFTKDAHLLAGTSTGAIVAVGLAAGKSLDSIRGIYERRASLVFRRAWLGRWGIFRGKYVNSGLRSELDGHFGGMTLGDLGRKVLVPTFDLDGSTSGSAKRWKPKFYKNANPDDPDCGERVVDVLLRTSAAQTYFPTVDGFIDGGNVVNNPSICAAMEVIRNPYFGSPEAEDVRMLSIGSGRSNQHVQGSDFNAGALFWGPRMVSMLFDGMSGRDDFLSRKLLEGRYARVQPVVDSLPAMDDWRAASELVEIAERVDLSPTVSWMREWWPCDS